jgi:acyl-CoA thioesterase-1
MPRKLATALLSLLIPAALACGNAGSSPPAASPASASPSLLESSSTASQSAASAPAPAPAAAAAASRDGAPLVAFLGDSLTAGLGLSVDQAYPALVERRMAELGSPIRALNGGVSGDTTAGGLRRLGWLISQRPRVVVVGLGGNDALRAQPLAEIESNLRQIVRQARQGGAEVLLLGMRIPPNYGPDYAGGFAAIYPRIAGELHVALVPFLLAGVGGVADLNQNDGIHPTAEGQRRVAANVTPYLLDLLRAHSAPAARAGN